MKAFEDAEKRLAEQQAITEKTQADAEDDDVTMLASIEDLPQGVAMEYMGSNEEFASFEVVEKDANKAHKSHQEQRRVFVMPMTSALKEKLFAAKLEKGDKIKVDKQEAKDVEKKTDEQIKKIKH
ncbi:hypothetical protein [Undibacterium sp. TC9W]|uniref:hypothetical protein n=1 Tax=Undibacterium sp. TC9W TaxID=3413053 RepID=UPI003BEFC005